MIFRPRFLLPLLLWSTSALAVEIDTEGELELEYRGFFEAPANPQSNRAFGSVAALLEVGLYDEDNRHAVIVKGFARGDSEDSERAHSDLREAKYRFVEGDFEAVIGLDKVFWGVTEFVHLVDIINQTDAAESVDGEQKLGQPMIRTSYVSPYGTFTAIYMPVFRDRLFAGPKGRPFAGFAVDNHRSFYESQHGDRQHDIAFRYNHFIGVWDVGLSYFDGTARDPLLVPQNIRNGKIVPFYPLREQISLDAQATLGPWLLKLEALSQDELGERANRAVSGVEYSFYGLFGSASDLGVVMEYMWDDRDERSPHPFNNDIGIGLRWTANDTQSTTLLLGGIIDLDHHTTAVSVEAERRLGDQFKLALEMRFQTNTDPLDPILHSIRDEDFSRLRLTYYF